MRPTIGCLIFRNLSFMSFCLKNKSVPYVTLSKNMRAILHIEPSNRFRAFKGSAGILCVEDAILCPAIFVYFPSNKKLLLATQWQRQNARAGTETRPYGDTNNTIGDSVGAGLRARPHTVFFPYPAYI